MTEEEQEMLRYAVGNFKNWEKKIPLLADHPLWIVPMAQLQSVAEEEPIEKFLPPVDSKSESAGDK